MVGEIKSKNGLELGPQPTGISTTNLDWLLTTNKSIREVAYLLQISLSPYNKMLKQINLKLSSYINNYYCLNCLSVATWIWIFLYSNIDLLPGDNNFCVYKIPCLLYYLKSIRSEKMAYSVTDQEDKYRSYLHGEGEKNTKWRFGAPPNYDTVNKLFEEGRTKVYSASVICMIVCIYISVYVFNMSLLPSDFSFCWWQIWPPGSLEEKVQNLVKTWEMEVFNKISSHDYKSINLENYTVSLNGITISFSNFHH